MACLRLLCRQENVIGLALTASLVVLTALQVYSGETQVGPNDTWEINPPFYVVKYDLEDDANLDSCIYQAAYAWNFHCSFQLQ